MKLKKCCANCLYCNRVTQFDDLNIMYKLLTKQIYSCSLPVYEDTDIWMFDDSINIGSCEYYTPKEDKDHV